MSFMDYYDGRARERAEQEWDADIDEDKYDAEDERWNDEDDDSGWGVSDSPTFLEDDS